MVAPILPALAQQYETTDIGWMLTFYALVGAVLTPLVGKLADVYGKRRLTIAIALIASIGTVVSAFAPDYATMLVGRSLAAVGIALLPLSYMLIRDTFPEKLIGPAIGISTTGGGISIIVGPYLAAWLAETFYVGAIFWFITAITVVATVLLALYFPETPLRVRVKLDILGMLLMAAGSGSLMFALSFGARLGWLSLPVLALTDASAVTLSAFVWRQMRIDYPLIELRVLASRAVGPIVLAGILTMAMNTVLGSVLPTFLQTPTEASGGWGLGLSATEAALVMLPGGAVIIATGFIVGLTGRKVGYKRYHVIGSGLMALGALLVAFIHPGSLVIAGIYVIMKLGNLWTPANANLLASRLPEAQRAVGSASAQTTFTIGSLIAVQIAFALLATGVNPENPTLYTESAWTTVFCFSGALGVIAAIIAAVMIRTSSNLLEDARNESERGEGSGS